MNRSKAYLGFFTRPGTDKTVDLPGNILAGDNFFQRNGPRPWKFKLVGMQVTAPATVANHRWDTLSTGGDSVHFSIMEDAVIHNTVVNNAVQAWKKAKGIP